MATRVNALVLPRRHLLALPLAACSLPTTSNLVIFIGDGSAELFEPWQKFRQAWADQQSSEAMPARLAYLATPQQDLAAKRALIVKTAWQSAAVLVAPTGNSALMAAAAGRGSVVFASFIDPIRAGLAHSDRYPGGRVTGISLADWLDAKRLQLLRDAFPTIRRVGVLADPSWAEHYDGEARVLRDAAALQLHATMYYGTVASDIDRLMSSPTAAAQDAWLVLPTNLAYIGEVQIAAHLKRLGVPGMFSTEREVRRGGALAYVADASFVYPKLAELAARVVQGEDPGRIPIERPRRYWLLARADASFRGEPISLRLLRRANRVV